MKKWLERLFNIKSIMAIILTITFAILAVTKVVTPSEFMTIFTAIVVYYFVDKNNKKE